jgi:hypothetical protein
MKGWDEGEGAAERQKEKAKSVAIERKGGVQSHGEGTEEEGDAGHEPTEPGPVAIKERADEESGEIGGDGADDEVEVEPGARSAGAVELMVDVPTVGLACSRDVHHEQALRRCTGRGRHFRR